MGWGLGDLSGDLLGYDEPPDVEFEKATAKGGFQDFLYSNIFFPQLQQFVSAAQASGMGALQALQPYIVNTPKSSTGFMMPTSADNIMWTKMGMDLPGLLQKAQEAQMAKFQKNYDALSKIPALSEIFSKAGGNVDSTGALANIFGNLSGSALGGAASTGFLSDPVKQANVLGPLALQKYQIEQSIQQGAQAQALGLAGVGMLPSTSAFSQGGINLSGGGSPYTSNIMNALGMFTGLNSELGFKASAESAANWNNYQMAGLKAQMDGFGIMFG